MARKLRAEALSVPVRVRLSPFERQLVMAAARVNHQNVSQFLRDALVIAAGDCLESLPPAVVFNLSDEKQSDET